MASKQSQKVGALITLTLSGLLALSFFVLSIFFTLPSNVLSIRDGSTFRTTIVDLAPQNWAFFTRSPREEEYIPYSLDDDEEKLTTPQIRPENLFGFSRNQRAQGVEIGHLLHNSTEWKDCSSMTDCIEVGRAANPVKITTNSNNPTICGESLLISRKIIPWEYRDFFPEEYYSYEKVSRLSVDCPR